jgi:hypothetical protein
MNAARVRDQVLASRRAQGLPDHVPAGRFLEELAAEVLAGEEEDRRGAAIDAA